MRRRRPLIPRSADDRAGLDIARRLREGQAAPASHDPTGIDPAKVMDRAALLAGMVALGAGMLTEAGDVALSLTQRYPGHPEGEYLGAMVAWWQYDDMHTAAALLERVVAARPDFALALYNLAYFWQRMGRDAEALALNERAIAADPTLLGAYVNAGNAHLAQGDLTTALDSYRRAAKLNSTDPLARYNRAIALLLQGEWAEGWREYETRWAMPLFRARARVPDLPRWQGEPLADDARLLVVAEQGHGDTLMAYRYAAMLEARFPGRVTWVVQAPLARLLHAVPETEPFPPAETFVSTMSLPHLLGATDGRAYLTRLG